MTTPLETVRGRLQKVRGNGRQLTALCPAHEDRNPSLSIKENDRGNVILHCFAGCNPQAIVSALGLEMRDLFSEAFTMKPSTSYRTNGAGYAAKAAPSVAELVEAHEKPVLGRRASEIEEEPITWLWEPFMPIGMFTLIDGEEGIGKTWVTLAIAASVSTGQGLFGVSEEAHIAPGNVLLISPEDSASQVIKPRLRLMGADMDRVVIHEEPINLSTTGGLLDFKRALYEYNPVLTVFDPIFACVGGIDLNQDNQIRIVTSQLKGLAEEFHCAMAGVRHIGKSKGMGNARNAGLGGVAWRASARSNVLIGKNPENDRERAIAQTKSNLLPDKPNTLGYMITDEGLQWTGPSKLTVDQMLSFKAQETHQERSEREEAKEFLKTLLRTGSMASKEVFKAARDAGLSDSTVRRAKADLGIQADKRGLGPWEWSLR